MVPLPETFNEPALSVPVVVATKSEVSTPVTGRLKVTVKAHEVALVGDAPTRTIELTVGLTESMVKV